MNTMTFASRQRGASLLEVLIAVLVLAIGMLGMAALQAVTIKNSNSASARSLGVIQVYSLFDTLRLNRAAATNGVYNIGWTCNTTSTPPEGSDADYSVFNGWLAQAGAELGDSEACGMINCGPAACTVGLRWKDELATGGDVEVPFNVVVESRL